MDRATLPRLRAWLARPDIVALDPEGVERLVAALDDPDPPVAAGRTGSLIAYAPGRARRRLLQFDRRGHLIAACRWRDDGELGWAKCLLPDGRWLGIEPGADTHPAWGGSDRVWLMASDAPWTTREALTLFQSLDYARPDFIPPLFEPRRLPPGGGTTLLNLIAGLMKDHGVATVRYRGPYPTEQLFTALLECFRYAAGEGLPLERFLADGALDWHPAPFEAQHVRPGVVVQLRHEIEKVTPRRRRLLPHRLAGHPAARAPRGPERRRPGHLLAVGPGRAAGGPAGARSRRRDHRVARAGGGHGGAGAAAPDLAGGARRADRARGRARAGARHRRGHG